MEYVRAIFKIKWKNMKVGTIEWEDNGKATGTFAPYIERGKNEKNIMFSKDGGALAFSTRKEARDYAKNWISEQDTISLGK